MLYIKGMQNHGDKIALGMFGGKQVDLLDWSGKFKLGSSERKPWNNSLIKPIMCRTLALYR